MRRPSPDGAGAGAGRERTFRFAHRWTNRFPLRCRAGGGGGEANRRASEEGGNTGQYCHRFRHRPRPRESREGRERIGSLRFRRQGEKSTRVELPTSEDSGPVSDPPVTLAVHPQTEASL